MSAADDPQEALQDSENPYALLHKKLDELPTTPGVYLMKDTKGVVLYIGKAVNLRSRVNSYFTKAARLDRRTADLVPEIFDLETIDTESEVEALLLEARLIKDIQPRYNSELKDDKSFPYLQITMNEDFPRIEFTRTPEPRGTKLYGPFTNAKKLRVQSRCSRKSFDFGTALSILKRMMKSGRWFRPRLLHSINQSPLPVTCVSARKITKKIFST
ncbi:MAG: GIY-YIG nuclease family protein [Planctomycetaceae bacterium]